jgi:hypothetical protein
LWQEGFTLIERIYEGKHIKKEQKHLIHFGENGQWAYPKSEELGHIVETAQQGSHYLKTIEHCQMRQLLQKSR